MWIRDSTALSKVSYRLVVRKRMPMKSNVNQFLFGDVELHKPWKYSSCLKKAMIRY